MIGQHARPCASGVKESVTGREGVRFAIEHTTEPRMLIICDRP